MFSNCSVILADVNTIQSDGTGQRTKQVTSIKKILGQKNNVGMSTYWNASSNNVKLDLSVSVRNKVFANEKYALINGTLYQIYNTGKSADPNDITLNMNVLKDDDLKGLIIDALGNV